MSLLVPTAHAVERMAQRGISLTDADLIALIGTEVEDGYLVLAKDCQAVEKLVRDLADRIRRLKGKRLVVDGGRIITAYRASQRQERHLLRRKRS